MKNKLLCLTACGMLILTMAACGSSQDENEASSGTEAATEAVAEETAAPVDTTETTMVETEEDTMSVEELNAAIAAQPVVVQDIQYVNRWTMRIEAAGLDLEDGYNYVRTKYSLAVVTGDTYRDYPDFLAPIFVNNSGTDIKDMDVLLLRWDQDKLPVKPYIEMKPYMENTSVMSTTNDGEYSIQNDPLINDLELDEETMSYIRGYRHSGINLAGGGTYNYGEDVMYQDADETGYNMYMINWHEWDEYTESPFDGVKALVLRYEDFDGNEWVNPYLEEWINMYAGKRLAE